MIYKSTLTIFSPFDPRCVELSALAAQAEDGSAICTQHEVAPVAHHGELPDEAFNFFNATDELPGIVNSPPLSNMEFGYFVQLGLIDADEIQGRIVINEPYLKFMVIKITPWGGAVADPDFEHLVVKYETVNEVTYYALDAPDHNPPAPKVFSVVRTMKYHVHAVSRDVAEALYEQGDPSVLDLGPDHETIQILEEI